MWSQPSLLTSACDHRGQLVALALVRVLWRSEGTCIIERVKPDNKSSDVVLYGTWRLLSRDEGPAVLDLEIEDGDAIEDFGQCLDKLMAQLVTAGSGWGFESFAPQSDGPIELAPGALS